MNILFITATYPPSANGVAVSTRRTVEKLRSLGHTVHILGPGIASGSRKEKGYIEMPTLHLKFWRAKDYPIPLPLPGVLARLPDIRWDLVHVHHPVMYLRFALFTGARLRAPVVYTYHTQIDEVLHRMWHVPIPVARYFNKLMVLSLCRRADGVIATTKWLRTVLVKRIGRNHVHYASTAGLTRAFRHTLGREALRKQLGLPLHEPVMLTVSRLVKEKGIEFLLQSFDAWHRKHKKGVYVIVGDGSDKDRLISYVKQHGLEQSVRFAGKVNNDDLDVWYSAADLFLYGSLTDTIGINIIEAMSAGLPVVATTHVTTKEVIRHNVNGILTVRTTAAFSRGIDEALKRKKRLGASALRTAAEYDIANTVDALISVYTRVSGSFRQDGAPHS